MLCRRIAPCRICGNRRRLRHLKNWINMSRVTPQLKAKPDLSKVPNSGNTMPECSILRLQVRRKTLPKVETASEEVIEAAAAAAVDAAMAVAKEEAKDEAKDGIG